MPVLAFLLVVGSVLVASLFVVDAKLKDTSPAIVTSQRIGLPAPQYHNATRTLTNMPAPAPDMTSQAVLTAQPKSASEGALAKIDTVARDARAEAPPKKARIEASAKKARAEAPPPSNPDTRPTTYQQTPLFDRFSIKGY
jgi:hypothetical protein